MEQEFINGLDLFGKYFIIGYALSVIYEIPRVLIPKNIAAVYDFFFMCSASVILYAYNIEIGDGRFRWFYIAGAFSGVFLYMVTLHKPIFVFTDVFRRRTVRVLRIFYKKLRHFAVFSVNYLKNMCVMVYNYKVTVFNKLKLKREVLKNGRPNKIKRTAVKAQTKSVAR